MRFAIIRKADKTTEKGSLPSNEMLLAMGRYNEELINAGVMRAGEGMRPTREGARLAFHNGQPTIINGPFTPADEQTAGFTIIEVGAREEAMAWASKWPKLDTDAGAILELRQLYEMEDFEQGEGTDLHRGLSDRLARQPTSACPYLFFPGTCREAFGHYADCLGGHVEAMLPYTEAPAGTVCPEVDPDSIMHACLRVGRWTLMGSDSPAEHHQKPQGFSVQIAIDDPDRAGQAFDRLAEGGQVQMDFGETFWAHRFGMVVDRYGIPWMINCNVQDCQGQ